MRLAIKRENFSNIDEKMTQADLACTLLRFLSEDSLPHGAAAALPKPSVVSHGDIDYIMGYYDYP